MENFPKYVLGSSHYTELIHSQFFSKTVMNIATDLLKLLNVELKMEDLRYAMRNGSKLLPQQYFLWILVTQNCINLSSWFMPHTHYWFMNDHFLFFVGMYLFTFK